MRLRSLLVDAGPWPPGVEPAVIAARLEARHHGARVFVTRPAAKRRWRIEGRHPRGAAEHFAADIEGAILGSGGTDAHVERVLLACMSSHVFV